MLLLVPRAIYIHNIFYRILWVFAKSQLVKWHACKFCVDFYASYMVLWNQDPYVVKGNFFFVLYKLAPVKIDGKTSLAAYCPLILQFSSFCLRRRRLCICLKCLTRNGRRVLRGSRHDLGSIICYYPRCRRPDLVKVFLSRSCN